MAKHRRLSERSVRTRTVIGGFAAGGALAALAPAGMAAAAGNPTSRSRSSRIRRAPRSAVRTYTTRRQVCARPSSSATRSSTRLLDSTRHSTTRPSAPGITRCSAQRWRPSGTTTADRKYYYNTATGSNGAFKGVLNTAPADQLGNVLPVRECNMKGDPGSGAPVFGIQAVQEVIRRRRRVGASRPCASCA